MLKTFKELEVWQKAHQLVLQTYRVTEGFPDKEKYGIISQVRRSAAAVPANIAEGFGRRSTKELLQFLANANGSLEETRYFPILGRDLGYLAKERYVELEKECSSVAQMIAALSRSLKSRLEEGVHGPRATNYGTRRDG